jgi:hypothetical protein
MSYFIYDLLFNEDFSRIRKRKRMRRRRRRRRKETDNIQ